MFKCFKDEVDYYNRYGGGHGLLKVIAMTLLRLAIFPVVLPVKLFVELYKWTYGYEYWEQHT